MQEQKEHDIKMDIPDVSSEVVSDDPIQQQKNSVKAKKPFKEWFKFDVYTLGGIAMLLILVWFFFLEGSEPTAKSNDAVLAALKEKDIYASPHPKTVSDNTTNTTIPIERNDEGVPLHRYENQERVIFSDPAIMHDDDADEDEVYPFEKYPFETNSSVSAERNDSVGSAEVIPKDQKALAAAAATIEKNSSVSAERNDSVPVATSSKKEQPLSTKIEKKRRETRSPFVSGIAYRHIKSGKKVSCVANVATDLFALKEGNFYQYKKKKSHKKAFKGILQYAKHNGTMYLFVQFKGNKAIMFDEEAVLCDQSAGVS